jgi:hypothetical protein
MSGQVSADERCQWDVPYCSKAATLHVSWRLDNRDLRDRHLCEGHMATVGERFREARQWPISACDVTCPIVVNVAVQAMQEHKGREQ